MRLWHEALIPFLSNKRLSNQHRECCALRGKGWGRKHATVDYVFTHSYYDLVRYHMVVMKEMTKRHYKVDSNWYNIYYRGKNLPPICPDNDEIAKLYQKQSLNVSYGMYHTYIYPEHDDLYLEECLNRLKEKGEYILWKTTK